MKLIFSALTLAVGGVALGLGSVAVAQTSYYYAGQEASGQQLTVDLDSISSAGNSDANFNYLLGDRPIASQAHCIGVGAWTTLDDGVVHYAQSQAARDMVRIVCSYLDEPVDVATAPSFSSVPPTPISAPATNIAEAVAVDRLGTNSPPIDGPAAVQTALVYDPSSNVRETPNGYILCSIDTRVYINIYGHLADDWYSTDACGPLGVIHISQIQF